MSNDQSQQVPHSFVLCDRDGERCFWPSCINHGCMAIGEPKNNLILRGETPDAKPVILDTTNL